MENIFSKKIIWGVVAIIAVAGIIGGIRYFIGNHSPGTVLPPESAETVSSNTSGRPPTKEELIKAMSVPVEATSTLPLQEIKKIKSANSVLPSKRSSLSASERQKLIDAMSVKQ